MCGLAGLFSRSLAAQDVLPAMLERIAHRGPDDRGLWADPEVGLSLGHLRLSIIDISPAGHQPMVSATGRYVLVYNGEIYNHTDLRARLEAERASPPWRGHSDTEVLLAAIEAWGLPHALEQAHGMFAFALWDRRDRSLTLARDRMGEKPLYFGWIGADFVFASELKAMAAHPGWAPRVDPRALSEFLHLGYHSGHGAMVRDVYRLPPGCMLRLHAHDLQAPRAWGEIAPRLEAYWRLDQVAERGQQTPWAGPLTAAANELERLLSGAVERQMVADVPLGAFLSGGFDSSLVVALMQRHSSRPVRTFSIGFDDPAHDEAAHARAVARHLGTDHHEQYVGDREALALVPDLPELFDEPLADPSQIPTLLVSRLARRHVTVALTGDGGDELFAGYTRYPAILRYWRVQRHLPNAARLRFSALLERLARSHPPIPAGNAGMRLARLAARHLGTHLEALRRSQIGGPDWGLLSELTCDPDAADVGHPHSPLRQLLLADQRDYLPNDILMKVDRASMSASLETRVPMLDPAVVEFSWRLRDRDLVNREIGKRVLREVAYRHMPRALLDRPKQGFAPPIDQWLRGALRDWAESLLAERPASLDAAMDGHRLRTVWRLHQAGDLDAGYILWRVLMYLSWARRFGVEG